MARYIKATECADIISEKFNIPLGDLVDVFAEIPTADVVPKSEVEELYKEIDRLSQVVLYHDSFKADEIRDAKAEVAREIFEEILEGLQYEIDAEDKHGRNAWAQGDVSGFQTHEYAEDKLETLQLALSLLKKKYTEEK